ncbi:hypothetical protein OOK06_24320 [Streptomyces sp. NBC_00340]|uniref:hypothetical protein n=1 Tax=Streptomyces sp. NBC_00340 TaxID=2975716 RepID=UPI0022554FFA|nr:hypothetical protein [Streptomyces sp. NBC_00340]MCX5135195.1 hypothetical protein [Streptomyces sp. NBC_00340]
MSGPMALEPGGAQDTLSLRTAGDRPAPRAPEAGTHQDAVDLLAAELADGIGPAVHPYEVAALLESEGLTAEVIQERYGHPNLFSLASALYERVPRTFPEPARPANPWRPDHVRCALRGALFALPGLAYPLTGPLWHAGRDLRVLVVAGLVSWAWGQALGHRAYLRMTTGRREAGRTLLKGAPLGALTATAAGSLIAGSGTAVAVAAAQSVYLAAAGVLLVLGGERLLLAALGPLVGGALALPWWEPGDTLRLTLPLLSVLGSVAAAGWVLRAVLATAPAPGGARPALLRSLPYGLFGLSAGILVLLEGGQHPYAVIVLTVSMGPAEWLLYRYRGMSVAALRATATPAAFLLRSAGVLGLCLLLYVLPLLPAALLTGAEPAPLLLLAATLWIALLLQAFGVAWPPAAVCLAAAGGAAAAAVLRSPPTALALSVFCGMAALCLTACAVRLLGRPAPHA